MRKNLFIALAVLTGLVISMTACDRLGDIDALELKALKDNHGLKTVNIAAIQGVTAPATGGIPVRNIVGNDQYTGTVTWSPNDTTFKGGIKYTATITLKPKDGYTLQMVKANFFTVAGADSVTNSANSGVIKAVFSTMLIDNVWANGTVSSGSEQWFKFTATASTQYIHVSFDTTPTFTALSEMDVQMYDSDNKIINYRMKGSFTGSYNSHGITYEFRSVTNGQVYYIKLINSSSYSGTYHITFNTSWTAPLSSSVIATATLLRAGIWSADEITTQNGQKWFKFTATASTQYIHFTPGSLLSLYVQVYDSNGNEIGSQTLLSSSLSTKYISRTVTSGQTYYISVVTLNGTVGTYQIAFNASTTTPLPLITLNSVTSNGSSTQTTTQLTLTFDKAITGLSADDITLSGVSGVRKGMLSGSNPYILPISGFTSGGTLSIEVTNSSYTITDSLKTVTIYYYYYSGVSPGAIEMVFIPSGTFIMGSPNTEPNRSNNETQHSVTLSSFSMGQYEVTQEQWTAVMGNNPSNFTSSPATGEVQNKRPVENVSWYNALVFCNKLSILKGLSPAYRISGSTDPANWGTVPTNSNSTWNAVEVVSGSNGYRLPTEAQWEYAAKGGNGSPGNYAYSGSNTVGDVAWYLDNSDNKTHEVGKKAPNGLGLYDMSGNVWEWCWDWYGSYSGGAQTNPAGADSGSYRVLRGGCCYNSEEYTRSAFRGSIFEPYLKEGIGFRLVRP